MTWFSRNPGWIQVACLCPPNSVNSPTEILGKPGNLLKVHSTFQPYVSKYTNKQGNILAKPLEEYGQLISNKATLRAQVYILLPHSGIPFILVQKYLVICSTDTFS
jgi:hypothetical protein